MDVIRDEAALMNKLQMDFARVEQAKLMADHQDVLRTALDFMCHSVAYWDEPALTEQKLATWYTADGAVVAESGWTGINVAREHHDYVWNVFKMFL